MKEYKLFDLAVQSEIPIEEAAPLSGDVQIEVSIRRGPLSIDPLTHPKTVFFDQQKKWWCCLPEENKYLFNGLSGEYEISDGREIIVHAAEDANEHYLRAYVLGTSFGVLQMQRGTFPIHGGTLACGGKALIITGQQGAGKSTFTGAMINRGYRFLSDDVSPVSMESGVPVVLPAYPQRKLCRDVCIALGLDLDQLVWINEERDKFAVRRPQEWYGERLPLGWIIEVIPEDTPRPRMEKVTGKDKLQLFFDSLYRPWIFRTMGIPPKKMKNLLTLTANTEMYRVYRPKTLDAVDMVIDLICETLL